VSQSDGLAGLSHSCDFLICVTTALVKEVSMPDPDYKALCAELLADYDNCHYRSELSDRARAALAQPAPAPTDEDLEDLAEVMNVSGNPVPAMRRALELWGHQ
jgi:hypothetical protein